MDFKVGNKVAVLDASIRGIIVEIIDKCITVKDDEETIYHFDSSELVKIEVEQDRLSNFFEIHNPLFQQKNVGKLQKGSVIKQEKVTFLEVDLHIDQLTANSKMMSNYEMLCLQIATAQKKLEYAMEKGILKIIFIHGVGKGVLKSELQALLSKYPVKYYDASYKKFGMGATQVHILKT